jgi:hypothetical protein
MGGGASTAGRTHPGAGACAALLAAAAADAQTAALDPDDPSALSATQGLSRPCCVGTASATEDARPAAAAGEAKPTATTTKPVVSICDFERFTSNLPCIPVPSTVDFTRFPVKQRIWFTCVARFLILIVDVAHSSPKSGRLAL